MSSERGRSSPRLRVVVFAFNQFGVEGLRSCLRLGFDVRRVFTHADSPGQWAESVADTARAAGVPVEVDADLKDPEVRARIAAETPDFLFSFYFRKMIDEGLLGLARCGAYNLHGSLLPRYRGASPVNWMLLHGETEGGITLHQMVRKADAGDIVAQQAVAIHPDQDAMGLTRQLLAITPGFLDTHLATLRDGTASHTPQDVGTATYYGWRRPEDGRLDPHWSAKHCHDLVRAVAPPWPGAQVLAGGRELRVLRSAVVAADGVHGEPGMILDDGTLACGTGRLALLHLAWADDGRPVALPPGTRLIAPPAPEQPASGPGARPVRAGTISPPSAALIAKPLTPSQQQQQQQQQQQKKDAP